MYDLSKLSEPVMEDKIYFPEEDETSIFEKISQSDERYSMALTKIIENEEIYLDQISDYISKYENPCRHNQILTSKEHNAIFGNIYNLKALSKKMLKYFQVHGAVEGFYMLTQTLVSFESYALNYTVGQNILKKTMKSNKKFRELILQIEVKTGCKLYEFTKQHQLPISRLYEYKRLFTNAQFNSTDTDIAERIQEILVTLEYSLAAIRKNVKDPKNYKKLSHLQSLLSRSSNFKVFSTSRRLLYTCTSTKGFLKYKKEKIFLFNDALIVVRQTFGKSVIESQWCLHHFKFRIEYESEYFESGYQDPDDNSSAMIIIYHGDINYRINFKRAFDACQIYNQIKFCRLD